jgi:hypothetical protein
MKRIFHPYWKWEDHQAGLYNTHNNHTEVEEMKYAVQAKTLLTNSEQFKNVALKVITEWKYAAEENLSNRFRNRQAWIGQASCCYVLGISEDLTKYGWRLMTPDQQNEANRVADEVITLWEEKHKCLKNTSLKMFLKPVKNE